MDAVNEMRLQDAQQRHEQLLEDIRQLNAKHRQEFQDKVKAKKVRSCWEGNGASARMSVHKGLLEYQVVERHGCLHMIAFNPGSVNPCLSYCGPPKTPIPAPGT